MHARATSEATGRRRLIEAGVRGVTLAYGRWDRHGKPHGTTFENSRHHFPVLDQGLSALLDDLRDSGMDFDSRVVSQVGQASRLSRVVSQVGQASRLSP